MIGNKENLINYIIANSNNFGFNLNNNNNNNIQLSAEKFIGGLSNPTYLIHIRINNNNYKLVLRKKPDGILLKGAHLIDREYYALRKLYESNVIPVPQAYVYCDDVNVIGTEFYLMEYIDGVIYRDPFLPNKSATQRANIYMAVIDLLVKLHSLNVNNVGLANISKRGHENYIKRQLKSWSKKYELDDKSNILALMDNTKQQISNKLPKQPRTTLVHGDFRLDNIIFEKDSYRILAILDWELISIGDPIADIANFALPIYSSKKQFDNCNNIDMNGIPPIDALLFAYCQKSIINYPIVDWHIHQSFAAYRTACICANILDRVKKGQIECEFDNNKVIEWLYVSLYYIDNNKESDLCLPDISMNAKSIYHKLLDFMKQNIYPREKEYEAFIKENPWKVPPFIEELKTLAKKSGLWNLFLCDISGITNLEYAHMAEIMGRNLWCAEVFNCQFPDTGNMETLHLFGNEQQKKQWLKPLLNGDIRSSFVMTEPNVASSDATNISAKITRFDDHYEINGKKHWISGAGDPRCKLFLFLGRTADKASDIPRHQQHSILLIPTNTPGIILHRPMTSFAYDDSPSGHFEVEFKNVKVPLSNLLYKEGRGFQIAQARLGPGRIHHCMRTIGLAQRSLELMISRCQERIAFNKQLIEFNTIRKDIADATIWISQTRLLCLYAAKMIDLKGAKDARQYISMIKVEAPLMALKVIDLAMQTHGASGLSEDFPLARWFSRTRTVRFMDGPDEVHRELVAKLEIRKFNSKL